MLSEQKFKKYWDADSSYFTRDNVWQFFKPHLQQPFDREAYKELLRSLPHIIALNHVKELLDALEALHTGGSEPDCENCDNKGKVICTSNGCPDCRFATHWIPCPQCKPVCATCGGSGKVRMDVFQVPCPACKPYKGGGRCRKCGNVPGDGLIICPAGPGDHRYVDERVKQQRQREETIITSSYPPKHLVEYRQFKYDSWGPWERPDRRVSDRRKGD